MKTSSKLLIALAICLVAAMFIAAISIRHQYDSIDKNDLYTRWKKQPLSPFRVLQVSGPSAARLQVEPGKTARMLADTLNDQSHVVYTTRVLHDTLFLHIEAINDWPLDPNDLDDGAYYPQLIVQTPTLMAVQVQNANCQIVDVQSESLVIRQLGEAGKVRLANLHVGQLTASLQAHNQLTIAAPANDIANATITVSDSARLFQYVDFRRGMTLTASPAATLRLTGKALRQVR